MGYLLATTLLLAGAAYVLAANAPAGTFWALKVEQRGWRSNLSPNLPSYSRLASRISFTLWYSPEVKYIVKSIYRSYGSVASVADLVSTTTTQRIRLANAESKQAGTTAVPK